MILLSSAAMFLSIIVLRSALSDGQVLKRAKINGDRSMLVRATIRHEAIRVIQHLLIVAAVVMTVLKPPQMVTFRNWLLMIFCVLFATNSLMDMRSRSKAMHSIGLRHKVVIK